MDNKIDRIGAVPLLKHESLGDIFLQSIFLSAERFGCGTPDEELLIQIESQRTRLIDRAFKNDLTGIVGIKIQKASNRCE